MTAAVRVKICGLTRWEDAQAACDAGADLLGFNFVPGSPRYVDPYTAREIMAHIPPFVSRVGVFAGEDIKVVNDLSVFLGLDAVQLHGSEDESYVARVQCPVIRSVRVGGPEDLEGLEGYRVSAFLLDARTDRALGGTGEVFPWELARDFCLRNRVFVAGGLGPDNVGEVIRTLSPYGVDAASGLESAPGRKDAQLMTRFIRTARCAASGNAGGCRHAL